MKIKLIMDFPEAKDKDTLRELARQVLSAGKNYSLIDFNILKWELDYKGKRNKNQP